MRPKRTSGTRSYCVLLVSERTHGSWRAANETVHGGPIPEDNSFFLQLEYLSALPDTIGETAVLECGAFRHVITRKS